MKAVKTTWLAWREVARYIHRWGPGVGATIAYYVFKEFYGSQELEQLPPEQRQVFRGWYFRQHGLVGRFLPFQSQPWPYTEQHQAVLQRARDFVKELERLGRER